jgi:hypothetical protein
MTVCWMGLTPILVDRLAMAGCGRDMIVKGQEELTTGAHQT